MIFFLKEYFTTSNTLWRSCFATIAVFRWYNNFSRLTSLREGVKKLYFFLDMFPYRGVDPPTATQTSCKRYSACSAIFCLFLIKIIFLSPLEKEKRKTLRRKKRWNNGNNMLEVHFSCRTINICTLMFYDNAVGAASRWWSKERMMVYIKLMMVKCSSMMVK